MVGLKLGCLNHDRLTFEAIERTGRSPFLVWIGNRIDAGFVRPDENVSTLTRLLGSPALAVIPPMTAPTPALVAEYLDRPALRAALGNPP